MRQWDKEYAIALKELEEQACRVREMHEACNIYSFKSVIGYSARINLWAGLLMFSISRQYLIISEALEKTEGDADWKVGMGMLQEVAQKGTTWSAVYSSTAKEL